MLSVKFHLAIILTLVFTFLAYSNIFTNQFVGDDWDFFVDWPVTQTWNSIPDIFRGINPQQHTGTYRPLRNLAMLVSRQVFGSYYPGYHLVSITVHLSITYLVYLICLKLSQRKPLSFFASLFFGLHPIHTEAVTFITASYDTISFLFGFLSFYLFLLHQQSSKNKSKLFTFHLSLITFLLAVLANETALVFPLLIALYVFLFIPGINIKKIGLIVKPYFIIAIGIYLLRIFVIQTPVRGTYQDHNFFLSMMVSLKAYIEYLKTFLLPVNLSISHLLPGNISTYTFQKYNLEAIRSQSMFDPYILFSLFTVLCLLFIVYKFRHTHPILSFSLGWIFISLLPVLNLIPTALIFSERYSYLSSFGFCLLVGYLFRNNPGINNPGVFNPGVARGLVCIMIMGISGFYLVTTYNRNQEWHSEHTFWQAETARHPNNGVMKFVLGKVYQKNGQFDQAVNAYSQAVTIHPDLGEAHYQLARIYQYQNQLDLSQAAYLQAVKSDPENSQIKSDLSQLYLQIGDQNLQQAQYLPAIAAFKKASQFFPLNLQAKTKLNQLCSQHPLDCR